MLKSNINSIMICDYDCLYNVQNINVDIQVHFGGLRLNRSTTIER